MLHEIIAEMFIIKHIATMVFKCDSCSLVLLTSVKLFEHIQQSCLSFYKTHPSSWAKILSSLGPNDDDNINAPASTETNTQSRRKVASSAASNSKSPSPSSSTSSTRAATPLSFSQNKPTLPDSSNALALSISKSDPSPYVCKCEATFKSLEHFKDHLKVCTLGKEPPFCIMFRAQDLDASRPQENVHMTVTDYFYGSITGKSIKLKTVKRRCNCYSCGKTLRNNIRFMSHLRHKIINAWENKDSPSAVNICQHCYRHYDSPFQLQCHVENVHGSVPAACTCRICELHFTSERTFLFHMKDKHVHNEAPYVCKVCTYRSSFYNDLVKHFREVHTDTTALMCPFCLTVSYNSTAFLKHVLQHIKSSADCLRCRLKFITAKDRALHVQNDHTSQVMKEKLKKYKNLSKCQVYVRVSSLQLAQRQNIMHKPQQDQTPAITAPPLLPESSEIKSFPKKRTSGPIEDLTGSPATKKVTTVPDIQLPAYLCPLKRPTRVKRLKIQPAKSTSTSSVTRCCECRESIPIGPDLVNHFSHYHECRWCVYVTACEKMAHKHVLKEHADAEMREQFFGKVEKPESPIFASSLVDEEEPPLPNIKTEPVDEVADKQLPQKMEVKEDKNKSVHINKSVDTSKPRRKQSNPMKIKNSDFQNSPSPKRVRKDRKVQTKNYEREKGSQTFETEFDNVDAQPDTNSNLSINRQPGAKILNSEKKKTLFSGSKHKKILAPEGFFPDIDDDAGWAKYFKEYEGKTWPGSNAKKPKPKLPTVPMSALPTMVPRSSTIGIQNKQQQLSSASLPTLKKMPGMPTATTGIQQRSVPSQQVAKTAITLSNSSQASTSSSASVLLCKTNAVTKSSPVYQFQIVPSTNVQKQIAPKPAPSPVQPLFGLVNQVQNMLSLVPRIPVDLRCLEVTHSSLLVQWDAPPNCLVTHYKVVFQGSGAPTVQLLPPEQTLVRLVGLKSDTMYVVRVYTLCNKSVSQYAFLYQKTNKLRRANNSTTSDDVVLVLDDNDPIIAHGQSYYPAKMNNVPTNSLTLTTPPVCVRKPVIAPLSSAATNTISLLTTTTSNNMQKSNSRDLKAIKQMQDESEKQMLINEILAGFKKNKNQKGKRNKPKVDSNSAIEIIHDSASSSEKREEKFTDGRITNAAESVDLTQTPDNVEVSVDNRPQSAASDLTTDTTVITVSTGNDDRPANKVEVSVMPDENMETNKQEDLVYTVENGDDSVYVVVGSPETEGTGENKVKQPENLEEIVDTKISDPDIFVSTQVESNSNVPDIFVEGAESTIEKEHGNTKSSSSQDVVPSDHTDTYDKDDVTPPPQDQQVSSSTVDADVVQTVASESMEGEDKENMEPQNVVTTNGSSDGVDTNNPDESSTTLSQVDDCDMGFNIVNIVSLSDQTKEVETDANTEQSMETDLKEDETLSVLTKNDNETETEELIQKDKNMTEAAVDQSITIDNTAEYTEEDDPSVKPCSDTSVDSDDDTEQIKITVLEDSPQESKSDENLEYVEINDNNAEGTGNEMNNISATIELLLDAEVPDDSNVNDTDIAANENTVLPIAVDEIGQDSENEVSVIESADNIRKKDDENADTSPATPTEKESEDVNARTQFKLPALPDSPVPPVLNKSIIPHLNDESMSDKNKSDIEENEDILVVDTEMVQDELEIVVMVQDPIMPQNDSPILQTELNDEVDHTSDVVRIDNESKEVNSNEARSDVDEVIAKDLENIVSQQTAVCDSAPTLDDIKNIMDEDLSWLS